MLFSISEPSWTTEEDSDRIKALRKRARGLYYDFTEIAEA